MTLTNMEMMIMTTPLTETEELKKLLGRDFEFIKLKDGKWIVEYLNFSAPATKLVGETQEEAVTLLVKYLKSASQLPA